MVTLNLADLDESEIKYKISHFPDGQSGIELTIGNPAPVEVTIKSRLNSFVDLEVLLCATAVLKNHGIKQIHLYVPYFLGARSDRAFTEHGLNYLKQIICPIINAQKFDSVTVLDPHSDVLEACLNNFKKHDNLNLFETALESLGLERTSENLCLIAPDTGALKKTYKIADHFGIKQVAVATKTRDAHGVISNVEIFNLPPNPDVVFVIVDDICDGGRTFINLAQILKHRKPASEINLVVTHGIFTAGFVALNAAFNKIITSNSYKNLPTQILESGKVIQTNVFKNNN